MKIGVIIRSVGERTEGLCLDSVKQCQDSNIHMIRNVKPFSLAVKRMFDIAGSNDYDWYFGLDADIILVEDWISKLYKVIEGVGDDYYRVDFPIYDRFLPRETYGVHLYNNKFTPEMKKILEVTKSDNKPEGNIRHKMSKPEYHEESVVLGYHGYHQYYRDIFSRFALRYQRDKQYIKRYKIFDNLDDEKKIAKQGWEFSKSNNQDFNNADSRSTYTGKEIAPLNITLSEFYKGVK